jgi:tRNA/rRNA methyltransferase/tRNA (cytidine32/uridine32-2'-O)-methyltransferase
VRPVEYDAYRLEGIAHDTADIIERIQHYDDLDSAIATVCTLRRTRHGGARRNASSPIRASPPSMCSPAVDHGPAALLFGREDKGLPNEALDRARVVVNIPTTAHASLNLAQAVLVALYELHVAAGDATRKIAPPRDDAPLATAEQYERLFDNAAQALEIIAFFKTRFPEHIMRSVRSLAYRANPDAREIELMRAMAIEVVRATERERKKTQAAIDRGGRSVHVGCLTGCGRTAASARSRDSRFPIPDSRAMRLSRLFGGGKPDEPQEPEPPEVPEEVEATAEDDGAEADEFEGIPEGDPDVDLDVQWRARAADVIPGGASTGSNALRRSTVRGPSSAPRTTPGRRGATSRLPADGRSLTARWR